MFDQDEAVLIFDQYKAVQLGQLGLTRMRLCYVRERGRKKQRESKRRWG